MIEFDSPDAMSSRFHCPMQGRRRSRARGAPIVREVLQLAVAPDRLVDLLGAGRHPELASSPSAPFARRLARDVGGALEILVRGVRAAADQRARTASPDTVLRRVRRQLREIGRARSGVCGPTTCGSSVERSISTTSSKNFSGSALDLRIRAQQLRVRVRELRERLAPGRAEIGRHALVVREDRGRRAQLGAHVRDRALAGARDRRARPGRSTRRRGSCRP